jgi:hypothetical protein
MKSIIKNIIVLLAIFSSNISFAQDLEINLSSSTPQVLEASAVAVNGEFAFPPFNTWNGGVITVSWPNTTAGGPGADLSFGAPQNSTTFNFLPQGSIICDGDICYQKLISNTFNHTQSFTATPTLLFRVSVSSSTVASTIFSISNPSADVVPGGTLSLSNSIFGDRGVPGTSSNTILPVNYRQFSALKVDNFTLLEWETVSEINNDFFDVERSADGRVFEKIGKVKGNGTTTETQNYEFIDREPFPGLNYYRLKQVDYNGDYEYSKVETVDFRTGTEGDVAIFPNPAVDYVNISLDRSYDGIRVTNSLGQLVEVLPAQLYESNQFRLDLTGYAPGVYFLEAKLGLEIVNKQFVKVK